MNMKSVLSFLVFGLVGCGTDGATAQAPGATAEAPETPAIDVNANSASARAVASLHLSNGNTVDFYDGGQQGILITELGKARTTPALKGMDVRALGAVNTWNALSPATPAPQALVELQARADAARAAGSAIAADPPIDGPAFSGGSSEASTPTARQAASGSEPRAALPAAACNNGCCDPNWVVNDLCPQGGSHSWLHFNVGWAWEQDNGISALNEVVCAATGTSRFGVHRGNDILSFTVNEGFFQTFSWSQGFCVFGCGSDNHSVVNTNSANQPVSPTNLHTFCGTVLFE